jgi:single-strand DNA-binding protein
VIHKATTRKKQPGLIVPTGPTKQPSHLTLRKGKQVYVEGTPEARSFQRNDGTPGSSLSLRVREIQLLGGKGDSTAVSSSAPAMAAAPSAGDMTDASDDLPF